MKNLSGLKRITLLCYSFVLISSLQGQNSSTNSGNTSHDTIIKGSSKSTPYSDYPLIYNPDLDAQISQVVRQIFQDKKGTLWFGTQDGACSFDGNSLVYHLIKDEFDHEVTIKAIVEDQNGHLWFGFKGGIAKFDGTSFTNFTEKDGLVDNDVWSLEIDQTGTLWIGTLNGLSRFNDNTFTTFSLPSAKPDSTRGISSANIVHSILEDSKGNIWFSTNGGAYIYNGNRLDTLNNLTETTDADEQDFNSTKGKQVKSLTNISEKEGLCNNNVNCILEAKDGSIWFATTHNGICKYDGTQFINISEQHGLLGREIWHIFQDRTEHIWFSVKGIGVYRFDGKSFTLFNEKNGLSSLGIMHVFEDRDGQIWLGGFGGLFRYDGNSFLNITKLAFSNH